MQKKKQKPSRKIWIALLLVLIFIAFFATFLISLDSTLEYVNIIPSPTHVLYADETTIIVSQKLPAEYSDELRIWGGSAGMREYIDHTGLVRKRMSMGVYTVEDYVVAYKGLVWHQNSFRIRVLTVDEKGFVVLAIAELN